MIKTILSGAIILFSLSSSVFADDHVMMVEWDGTPGYLESTIMADTTATGEQAHEIYMLEANKVYLQLSELKNYALQLGERHQSYLFLGRNQFQLNWI